jgi:uncharacterized membrane-anchored protein YhcB (DUF1043 family)
MWFAQCVWNWIVVPIVIIIIVGCIIVDALTHRIKRGRIK